MNKKIILIACAIILLIVLFALFLFLRNDEDKNATNDDVNSNISSIYDEDIPSENQIDINEEGWTSIYEAKPVN